MKDITVIIPLTVLSTKEEKVMFSKSVQSVPDNIQIICVGNDEALDSAKDIETINYDRIKMLTNVGDTTLPSQVNLAVENIDTKYFTVLEFDDIFTSHWFENVVEYSSSINENVVAYLPLTEIVDFNTSDILGYANEAFWASSFSEEIGFMDNTCLQDYLNINTHGGVFDKEMFQELGKLKASMKILYWYEFLLRATYKGKKVFIIPKVGYIHNINRPGSSNTNRNMTETEFDWWLDLANKEYFFNNDRNKTYQEEK